MSCISVFVISWIIQVPQPIPTNHRLVRSNQSSVANMQPIPITSVNHNTLIWSKAPFAMHSIALRRNVSHCSPHQSSTDGIFYKLASLLDHFIDTYSPMQFDFQPADIVILSYVVMLHVDGSWLRFAFCCSAISYPNLLGAKRRLVLSFFSPLRDGISVCVC